MSDVLDASALISSLPKYLPPSESLNNPQDAIAALVHTILSVLGFRLVGIDESTSADSFTDNVLSENWNSGGAGNYTLCYRHEQSSLQFIVKVTKLGTRTLINAIATETDKTASLDIATNDYTSPAFFPYTHGAADAAPLVHGFISSARVKDFVTQFKNVIIQKLIPGLRKEGYSETADDTSNARGQPSSSQNRTQQPARSDPSLPFGPPDWTHRPTGLESHIPPDNPLQIGRRDLDPLPMQIQPNPFAPPPLFPVNQGDGMYVGPDHPIFGGVFGPQRSPSNRGPWGGDGYLPPMGAPPGARFDPIFPDPFGPSGRRPGQRGLGGRGPRRDPRSGDPDNDEFMPPGMGDMFS